MMDKTKLQLVGGGGHCHSVIESIERTGMFDIVGISEVPGRIGENVLGYSVNISDEELPLLANQNLCFLITIGQIKTFEPRKRLFELLEGLHYIIATVIDPSAVISKRATIGKGTVVLRNAFINTGVSVGCNCIINTSAIIEHDSTIGNHVHISTGAIINGSCIIGDGCFIGSGAIISNGITIGPGAIVGAGAVVLKSIDYAGTYLGNPAMRIK